MSDQALLKSIIINHSTSDDFDTAVHEWDFIMKVDLGEVSGECECGMHIRHEYHILNRLTKHPLILGCVCICQIPNYMLKSKLVIWVEDAMNTHRVSRYGNRKVLFAEKHYGKTFEQVYNSMIFMNWIRKIDRCNKTDRRIIKSFNDFKDYCKVRLNGKL